ncbi:MAG: thioredoxin family protein [Betaproteobacteria bacterium]|nr:thioredoxin family protein [Betaproteobacteria bacterium]
MNLPRALVAGTVLGTCGALALVLATGQPEARAADRVPVSTPQSAQPYREAADAKRDIDNALGAARKSGKNVLLVFGANGCTDCNLLNAELSREKLDRLVRDHCHVVRVDVGRMNKNLDIVNRYDPGLFKKGIPAVVLLDSTGKMKNRTAASELADARKTGADAIGAFFASMLGKAT